MGDKEKKNRREKNFLFEKLMGGKTFCQKKKCWKTFLFLVEKKKKNVRFFSSQPQFLSQKIWSEKNSLVGKFWGQTYFWFIKCLSRKKIWTKRSFGQKKFWSGNFLGILFGRTKIII